MKKDGGIFYCNGGTDMGNIGAYKQLHRHYPLKLIIKFIHFLDLLLVSDNLGGINPSGPRFWAASFLSANNSLMALNQPGPDLLIFEWRVFS